MTRFFKVEKEAAGLPRHFNKGLGNWARGSFTLATAVCGFRSRLCQGRDRKFFYFSAAHNHPLWNPQTTVASVNEP